MSMGRPSVFKARTPDRTASGPRSGRAGGWAAWTKRLHRDRAGATAIEFAMIAGPFFGFVFLIFQVALYHFGTQSLDHAVRQAARQVMIGSVPASARTLASFKAELICPKLLVSISCDRLVVNAYKVDASSNAAAGTGIYRFIDTATTTLRAPVRGAAQATFCLGGPSDYVFLDVAYDFPNFVGSLLSGGGERPDSYMMRSTSFFRNEPFPDQGASC